MKNFDTQKVRVKCCVLYLMYFYVNVQILSYEMILIWWPPKWALASSDNVKNLEVMSHLSFQGVSVCINCIYVIFPHNKTKMMFKQAACLFL